MRSKPSVHALHTGRLATWSTAALALALALPLTGCDGDEPKGGNDDDTTAESGPYCEDTITVLDSLDAVTPEGSTAAELLGFGLGQWTSELAWVEQGAAGVSVDVGLAGSTTKLDLGVAESGEVRWVESEAVYPAGGPDIAVECPPRVEVDVEVTATTEDGALAETLAGTLVRFAAPEYEARAMIDIELDVEALAGSLAVVSYEPADPNQVWWELSLGFTPPAVEGDPGLMGGNLGGVAEYIEGEGPDGVAMAGTFEVARWGEPIDP